MNARTSTRSATCSSAFADVDRDEPEQAEREERESDRHDAERAEQRRAPRRRERLAADRTRCLASRGRVGRRTRRRTAADAGGRESNTTCP